MSREYISNESAPQSFRAGIAKLASFLADCPSDAITIGLPGGRSVVGLLEAWLEQQASIPQAIWSRLHFYMIDERLVPLSSELSNFKLLQESFFTNLVDSGVLQVQQIHPFLFDPENSDAGAAAYGAELEAQGGKFDVAVLGVGEDAHVGALFPAHPALSMGDKLFLTLHDSPKPPPDRMTSSLSLLGKSGLAIPLFIGEGKRDAALKFLNEDVALEQCPAKVALSAQQTLVLSDLDCFPMLGSE